MTGLFNSRTPIDVITLLLIGVLTLGWLKFYKLVKPAAVKIANDANQYSVKEDSCYSTIVQKIICKLKFELKSTKIVIGRFHNGGNYVNGLPMKKFTLTHETAGGTDLPMMDKCVAVLNSRYSQAFAQLATLYDYCVADVNDCPDLNFKRDMELWKFKSCYLFLMRQFDGKEDGFVGVNFKYTNVMSKEQRHMVEEQIPRIIGLLNMQKEHLKGD
jgi:hypothetical protein